MTSRRFVLGTRDNLSQIVDECIAAKRFALDLETTGLDNRVFNGRTRDHIAGVCLSPDPSVGYYIPLTHVEEHDDRTRHSRDTNIPRSVFDPEFLRLIAAVDEGRTVAVFHNAKFDQEFLEFNGGSAYGTWDKPGTWDDTMILAALRNSRARQTGLKALAGASPEAGEDSGTGGPGLGMEMIELRELWGHETEKKGFRYDFTTLDPTEESTLLYACSDAICTLQLYHLLAEAPGLLKPDKWGFEQNFIYKIEKGCLTASRWMERNRIHIDQKTVIELIRLGQAEWMDAIETVYREASNLLRRDVMPGYYKYLKDHFVADPVCSVCQGKNPSCVQCGGRGYDTAYLIETQIANAHSEAKKNPRQYADPRGSHTDEANKAWPMIYDVNAPVQLGQMFEEMNVPGLRRTEKSGQVKTSKDEIERVIEEAGTDFPFMAKIRRFREVSKALSSYLYALLRDVDPDDGTIRINFRANKVDTGRFSTPAKDAAQADIRGMPAINFQAIPRYDSSGKSRPVCMGRLRECIKARPGKKIVAIDYSGEELRLITNLSLEPKWLKEFFHCAECDRMFSQGDGNTTPVAPPPFCPNCGSDKIGDLHTLTALEVYGADARNKPDWKELRGYAKCVHPDTLIRTDSGVHRIGLLPSKEDVFLPVGGKVWAGEARSWIPLLETYGGGEKPLYHVVTRRGVLTCSAQHRIALADGSLASIEKGLVQGASLPEPDLTPLVQDSVWPVLRHRAFPGVPPLEIRTGVDLAYAAGVILGDGSKSVSSCSVVHGPVGEVDKLGTPYETWQGILVEAFKAAGFDPVPKKDHVYLGSRHVIRYWATLQTYTLPEDTHGTRRLRIPDWVWAAGPQALFPFLGGLFDTDGTVSAKDKNLSVTTKDPVFAGHVATALQVLGMPVSLDTSWNKTYNRWYYRIKIFREDSVRFVSHMKHPGKVARLLADEGLRRPECGRRKSNEVLLILEAGAQPCMDLHVGSDDHLYWANGFLSHNSLNFAMSYGGGGSAAQRAVGCSKQEGARIKHQFDSTYSTLQRWWKSQHRLAKERGYVFTAFKRKYPCPDINNPDGFFRSKAERNSVNGPIQGAGADICKIAMALVFKECQKRGWLDRVQMIATMHDELVYEIDDELLEEAIFVLVPLMCRNPILLAQRWPIPLTCDVEFGDNWSVPYHFEKCRHEKNKDDKTKQKYGFPPEIAHLFPNNGFPPGEGLPLRPVVTVPDSAPVPAPAEPVVEVRDPVDPAVSPTVNLVETPRLSRGDYYDFRLIVPLTMETVIRLAEVIQKSRDRGTRVLRLWSAKGESLDGWLDHVNQGQPIFVSDVLFYAYALDRGLCA
jgi:DNA polymerase I-like protein with 3'-5' exonuclease and polymerase domains